MLFSFQETGTVLSLGLNVGGYVECRREDGPADVARTATGTTAPPRSTASGCGSISTAAASANLDRPGPLTAGGAAPGLHRLVQRRRSVSRAHWMTCASTASPGPGGRASALPQRPAGLERFAREREEHLAAVYAPGAVAGRDPCPHAREAARTAPQRRPRSRYRVAACAKQRHPQDYADFAAPRALTGRLPSSHPRATTSGADD